MSLVHPPTIDIHGYIGIVWAVLFWLSVVELLLDSLLHVLIGLLLGKVQQFEEADRSKKLDPLLACVAAKAATDDVSWYDR